MNKKIGIAALVVGLVVIVGVGFYIISAEPKNEAVVEAQENRDAEHEDESQKKEQPTGLVDNENRPPQEHEERRQPMRAAEANNEPPNPEASARNEAMLEKVIKKQVSRLNEDLFKELALPEEKRKQVEDHLAKSMRSESEFGFKMLDPNISVEEILREQDRLSGDLRGELGKILSPQEQDLVIKHQNNVPKKMQKEQITMLVDNLNLQGPEKENVMNAVERAVQGVEQKKRIGEYTAQDIIDFRKPFHGTKPGDPEFMRATIEVSSNQVKSLLKGLENLPKEQYEAIKKQMEMPLEMMREGLKQQNKQGG